MYLGADAKKAAARRTKGEIEDLIADRFVGLPILPRHIADCSSEADIEDDEESREWENAQAQRAGGYEQELKAKPTKAGYRPAPSKPCLSYGLHLTDGRAVPAIRPIPTIASAQSRIAAALSAAEAIRADAEQALEAAASELSLLEEQERGLKQDVDPAEAKREWFEEFRGWSDTLGEFLEEKVSFHPRTCGKI